MTRTEARYYEEGRADRLAHRPPRPYARNFDLRRAYTLGYQQATQKVREVPGCPKPWSELVPDADVFPYVAGTSVGLDALNLPDRRG